ncbi:unnamed protein product [Urochloa humidicola]
MSSSSSASAPLDKPRTVVKKLLAESQPEGQGGRAPPSAGASAGMSSGTWTPSSCSTSSQVGLGLFLMRAQMVLHQILEPCLQPTLPLNPCLVLAVSKPAGFPDHPHRGFETVTYMLEGAFTHQDFAGHKGTIRAGDVQVSLRPSPVQLSDHTCVRPGEGGAGERAPLHRAGPRRRAQRVEQVRRAAEVRAGGRAAAGRAGLCSMGPSS